MELPALLISDLHLTDNPQHEYRWGLFDHLDGLLPEEGIKTLAILGDLTDAKDFHSATLTNRVVQQVMRMRQHVKHVTILLGNHDYLKRGHAYFDFLNKLDGVRFVVKPYEDLDGDVAVLWLPHTKTPGADWGGLNLEHFNYVFMHQTVTGSVTSNGQKMQSDAQFPDMRSWPKIYSGDIHVPQTVGPVEYVGSPYPVHFGDTFAARMVLIDRRRRSVDLAYQSVQRATVTVRSVAELRAAGIGAGDHVKLRIQLASADKHEWSRVRRECAEYLAQLGAATHGVELQVEGASRATGRLEAEVKISDLEALRRFVVRHELGAEVFQAGAEIVEP